MRHTSNVRIIRGGVIGCAIAYHPRKMTIAIIVLGQGEIGARGNRDNI